MFPSGYPVSRKAFNRGLCVWMGGWEQRAERGTGALAVIVKTSPGNCPRVLPGQSTEVIPTAVCPQVTNTPPGKLKGIVLAKPRAGIQGSRRSQTGLLSSVLVQGVTAAKHKETHLVPVL